MSGNSKWLAVVLVAVISAGGSGYYSYHKQQERRQAEQRLMQDMQRAQQQMDQANSGQAVVQKLDETTQATGQTGRTELAMRQIINQVIEVRNGYTQEIAALQLDKLLEASNLQADPDLSQSLARLDKAAAVVERYRLKSKDLLDHAHDQLAAKGVGAADLNSFDAGLRKNRSASDETWTLEARIVVEMRSVMELLRQHPEHWTLQGGQLTFNNPSSLNQYQQHIRTIQELVAREQSLQQQMSLNHQS